MNEKIQASVFIICKNEEKHIRRVLCSVDDFADVVLVDSGSTDGTLKIAGEFDCRVFHQDWLGYAAQKKHAASLCRFDWVLNLDADEELSPELKEEIARVVRAPGETAGLSIAFQEYFIGHPAHPWTKQHRRVRCFRRSRSHYPEKLVHEHVELEGAKVKARGVIRHYGEDSIWIKVEKNNQYSELRALEKARAGKKPSVIRMLAAPPFAFFKSYVMRRGILNGWRGFVGSSINAFYAFLKEAKLLEKHATRESA